MLAVPIIDFRYLGAPARVMLDWDDPWYTKFDNPNLKRHKSVLLSFIYVEPYARNPVQNYFLWGSAPIICSIRFSLRLNFAASAVAVHPVPSLYRDQIYLSRSIWVL